MIFVMAFLVGGLICGIGQYLMDRFKLTPGHITAYFVMTGALLDALNIYDNLIKVAGAGALVPITSFGHSLIHGALSKAEEVGFLGLGLGMFDMTAVGITSAIIFAFIFALFFRPKG